MKILIVDDSSTLRRVLNIGISKAMNNKSFTVLEAENGEEGLAVLHKNRDIDYVFLDVNMPVMKGDEMLKIMRADPAIKHIRVIMQTTVGIRERVAEFTELGISGYLLKPYNQDVISQLMGKIIERKAVKA
jgi:two-component system chemotaxis response regulator CheY